jgi:hypothetical protein
MRTLATASVSILVACQFFVFFSAIDLANANETDEILVHKFPFSRHNHNSGLILTVSEDRESVELATAIYSGGRYTHKHNLRVFASIPRKELADKLNNLDFLRQMKKFGAAIRVSDMDDIHRSPKFAKKDFNSVVLLLLSLAYDNNQAAKALPLRELEIPGARNFIHSIFPNMSDDVKAAVERHI